QGSALLTGDNFNTSFSTGRVGALTLSRGKVTIANLHVHGAVGAIGVHVDGGMSDIMTLIDMKPLGFPTRFGIKPSETGGHASVDLAFQVPMLRDLPVDAVGISVKAAVSNFAVILGSHTHITDGTVNFVIDNSHLHQTGVVSLADSRLAVDWTEDFKTQNFVTTHLLVKGTLRDGARSALNLGLEDIVTGPVDVTANITGHRGGLKAADLSLDLTQATLAVGFVGLGKPAGAPATAHVTADFAPGDLVQDETVHIAGPGIAANGAILFDKTGALASLNFPSVKMGPLNDLSFAMTRGAAGTEYTVRGRSLDGTKIGHSGAAGTGSNGVSGAPARKNEAPQAPFHITSRLDRMVLRDGVVVAPFALDASGTGERLAGLTLSGNLSKTVAIAGSIDTSTGNRRLNFTAGDAGLLAKGLFGFTSLRGGKIALAVTLPGRAGDGDEPAETPDYQGTLTVSDFMVVNQPFLSRLFAAGSLTGFGNLMQGDGISLEKMEVPFTSRNGVITVHDAIAHGRAIGATADGYIDRPKNSIALKGSLVPAYGLNSVLGNIPLLGDLLVSKKGEGIFGITYSVYGDADQPSISVNPLAVLTPGILRRIFEGNMPNAANAPSNAPLPKTAPVAPAKLN
ncbi:MAG TPA: AsmA-like C-terminal domain-containing protein, partial [Rhizomicrobium sp.]